MAAPRQVQLQETSPGIYSRVFVVPADMEPGTYEVRGYLVLDSTLAAAQPSALLRIGPVAPPPAAAQAAAVPAAAAAAVPAPTTAAPEAITGPGGTVPPPCPPAPAPAAPAPPPEAAAPSFFGGADYVNQGIRPDLPFWVTPNDTLVIAIRNSAPGVVIALGARLWVEPENFAGTQQVITPTSDRSLNLVQVGLVFGYLTGVAVTLVSGAPVRGQCLVAVYLQRGAGTSGVLWQILGQDYVTSQLGPTWPYGRLTGSGEFPGVIYNPTISDPAAGSEMKAQVPTNARWRILKFGASLRASGVGIARQPNLQIWSNGTTLATLLASSTVAVGSFVTVDWWPGLPVVSQTGPPIDNWLHRDLILPAGASLRTDTFNMQPGDQWTGARLIVEEVIDG